MTRIKDILKERGMTINDLADKLGVSRQALGKQIQGKMLIETASRIADALGVPMWQLFASSEDVLSDKDTTVCPHCGNPIRVIIGKR